MFASVALSFLLAQAPAKATLGVTGGDFRIKLGSVGWFFDPKPLATYLDSSDVSILVAAGGEKPADAREAAKALRKGLRATGKTHTVMDDGPLGERADLTDRQIVDRAARYSVDVIAVLRIFDGGVDAPPTAVATFLNKKGEALAAFTVTLGTALAPRSASSALPSAALESVERTLHNDHQGPEARTPEDPHAKARQALDDQAIWNQRHLLVDARTGALVGGWMVYYKGKYGPVLEGGPFYEQLGRSDLAASYRRRSTLKFWTALGGGIVLTAGVGVLVAGLLIPGPCTTIDSLTDQCISNQLNGPLLIAGGVATGVGLAALIVGLVMDPNPISGDEAAVMVEQYNDKLEKDLGLSLRAPSDAPAPRVSWNVLPFVVPSGGGALLQVRL